MTSMLPITPVLESALPIGEADAEGDLSALTITEHYPSECHIRLTVRSLVAYSHSNGKKRTTPLWHLKGIIQSDRLVAESATVFLQIHPKTAHFIARFIELPIPANQHIEIVAHIKQLTYQSNMSGHTGRLQYIEQLIVNDQCLYQQASKLEPTTEFIAQFEETADDAVIAQAIRLKPANWFLLKYLAGWVVAIICAALMHPIIGWFTLLGACLFWGQFALGLLFDPSAHLRVVR